jgi:cytochrome P450
MQDIVFNVEKAGTTSEGRIPPGPAEHYSSVDDLFAFMNQSFERFGDMYKATIFGSNVYVVSNPEYCERILRWNWRNYPRKGQVVKRISLLLGNGLISSNGEFWASQRRMIQPAFAKSAIAGLTDLIAEVNAEQLAAWTLAAQHGQKVNVTRDLGCMVLKLTLRAIFGEDYVTVAPHFDILAAEATRNLGFAQVFRPVGDIIRQIVHQRRRDGSIATDFLASMMQARDRERGEPMPDVQLIREVMTLIVAGHETTASLLNWLWYLLSTHPDVQARVAAELDGLPWSGWPSMDALPKYNYVRQVIDEALRLYPPLWLMTRKALHADVLGEFLVPAGTEIYISPYLIQRSPAYWEMPDRFDPDRMGCERTAERHDLALCPFGAGPRNCIGEAFARAEIQIHLMMFARELHLRYDDALPAEVTTGINLLSKHDFMMTPEIRVCPTVQRLS